MDEGTIKQISADSNYQKNLEGYTYHVLERRYGVVADKSGSLKIQPPVLTGYTRKNDTQGRNGMFHWMNAMLEPLRVSANPTILDIKPMPEGITLAKWLPAKSFSIHEDWSVSASAFQLGQPITRTITMEATGITAEKLPEINQLDHPDLLIYPDKPQMENSSGEKELLAKRTEKLAIIPTKTGEIQLPQIDVKWWNIDQDRFEIASLPARTIQVTAPAAANPLHSSSSVSGSPSEISQSREEDSQLSNTPLLFKNERTIWISIVSALLLAWGLTLLFWRKNSQHPSEISSALIQSAKQNSIHELKKQFKSAALNNQPNQSRQALIEWAKWIWPSQDIRTLGDIEKCLCNPHTKELLRELDQCIYTNQSRHWNGKALWEKLEKEMDILKKSGSKQPDELPSLYL